MLRGLFTAGIIDFFLVTFFGYLSWSDHALGAAYFELRDLSPAPFRRIVLRCTAFSLFVGLSVRWGWL